MPPKYFDLNVPLKTPLFVVNYFFVAITRFLGGTFCSNLVVRGTKTFYATGWHSASLVGLRLRKEHFLPFLLFFLRNTNKEMVVNRASENGGESGSATVVDMVEESLVHHMPAVSLDTIM